MDYEAKASGSCGISKVTVYIDGKEVYDKNAGGLKSISDTVTFDISEFKPGSKHTVKVVAVSTTGQTASDEKTFKICQIPTEKIPVYFVPSHHTSLYFVKDAKGNYHRFGEHDETEKCILSGKSCWKFYKPVKDLIHEPTMFGELHTDTGALYDTRIGTSMYVATVPSNVVSELVKLAS